jgi:hypothetical protein
MQAKILNSNPIQKTSTSCSSLLHLKPKEGDVRNIERNKLLIHTFPPIHSLSKLCHNITTFPPHLSSNLIATLVYATWVKAHYGG